MDRQAIVESEHGAVGILSEPGHQPAVSGEYLSGRTPAFRRPIPPKLYRIGEVVEYSGVSRQTIHNYTTMGLIQESRWTSGGHRLYDESVFSRLDHIAAMKAQHKTLQDIREHFDRQESLA